MAFRRILITAIGFVIQVAFYISVALFFGDHIPVIDVIYRIIGVVIVLYIIRTGQNLNNSLPWIMLILLFPILGTLLYVFMGNSLMTSKRLKELHKSEQAAAKYYHQDETVVSELNDTGGQMAYLYKYNHFPVYKHNHVDYYPLGDDVFAPLIADLQSAEHFIFLEYFIIQRGQFWDAILEVLKEKVKAGVDVRVMYDDFGCVAKVEKDYNKKLEKLGIKCVVFNRLNALAGVIMNNRDHRKILVIDGKIAYTGGINLADEYINIGSKYGHWKDNAIRVKGRAVYSFTLFFLTTWNSYIHEDPDFSVYDVCHDEYDEPGYVIPYCDAPLDDEDVGADVYMNILSQAKDYVYIMTPYFIIDEEMMKAMTLAAKRGVDVRVIVPGIPDKKIVYTLTQSYFPKAMKNHIKIYTYTPGFVHAKVFVSDDRVATVGTINMDYRSLALHFENGLYMKETTTVMDVKADVLKTLEVSHQLSDQEVAPGIFKATFQAVLRVLAPLF